MWAGVEPLAVEPPNDYVHSGICAEYGNGLLQKIRKPEIVVVEKSDEFRTGLARANIARTARANVRCGPYNRDALVVEDTFSSDDTVVD
jgi:hypothetical protein